MFNIITSFLEFIDAEKTRRNTSTPVVAGLYGGMIFNALLFFAFWVAAFTQMDLLTFLQANMLWYAKILYGLFFLVISVVNAYLYGEMASALTSLLFGFYTLKSKEWGPKVFSLLLLTLLLLGFFPYMAMVGFISIRAGFNNVGHMDFWALLLGGAMMSILSVVIPGLFSDPQTMGQKQAAVLNRLLTAAEDSAVQQIAADPILALQMVGVNALNGGAITDQSTIFDMLQKRYPNDFLTAKRLSQKGAQFALEWSPNGQPIVQYALPPKADTVIQPPEPPQQ